MSRLIESVGWKCSGVGGRVQEVPGREDATAVQDQRQEGSIAGHDDVDGAGHGSVEDRPVISVGDRNTRTPGWATSSSMPDKKDPSAQQIRALASDYLVMILSGRPGGSSRSVRHRTSSASCNVLLAQVDRADPGPSKRPPHGTCRKRLDSF